MSSRIADKWRPSTHPRNNKFIESFKGHSMPIKEKLHSPIYRLKAQNAKIHELMSKIQAHDKKLFNKCVESQVSNDRARAAMYAAECGELRKIAKIALASQLALEKIILRMETISQFGDIASEMAPVSQAINIIKDKISGVMPNISYELSEVAETLNETVLGIGESTILEESQETQTEESQEILNEAHIIAEQRIQDNFPEIPLQKRILEDISESQW